MRLSHGVICAVAALATACGTQNAPEIYDFDEDGSADAEDCGASDPTIRPGAQDDWGDGIDQACDGLDGTDADGDGYPSDAAADPRDCNDSEPTWYPGAPDSVDPGGLDTNCDGVDGVDEDGDGWPSEASGGTDCDDTNAEVAQAEDSDEDGVTGCGGDCDDQNAAVGPHLEEACDGLDTNCDGSEPKDEADEDGDGSLACNDCDDTDGTLDRRDIDGDGVTTCGGDCNDELGSTYPGANDPFSDGLDTNCDGADGIDADGDGQSDLLIGVPNNDEGGQDAGKTYLLLSPYSP